MWEAGASDAERYDLDGGDGRRWTRIEQAAGADPTRLLTQADPLPQSIYRVPVQPDGRIAVRLTLKYRHLRASATLKAAFHNHC